MSFQKTPPSGRLSKKPDLRIRDIPEWQSALVFDPDQPDLHMINMTSRLIIELCDGRTYEEIEGQYCDLIGQHMEPEDARKQFSNGLDALRGNGLVAVD